MNDQTIAKSVLEFASSLGILQEWPEFRQLLLNHLSREPVWNLALPVFSCQAVGGASDDAIPVAVAWSTLHYSAHIFDAIQDGQSLPVELGSSEKAISFATAMMFTGHQIIGSIPNVEATQRLVMLISEAGFYSSMGQYASIDHNYDDLPVREALEAYWQTVIYKSGSIFRVATGGGAAVGTSSWDQINAIGAFGNAIGVMLQVIDDCRDVLSPNLHTHHSNYEVSLPLLLYRAAVTRKEHARLDTISLPQKRDELFRLLQSANVPQVIVSILQEWRQRALISLAGLEKSDARTRLEAMLDIAWEPKIANMAEVGIK